MSGRCALYYCLEDLKEERPGLGGGIAYLPAYTCETVIAPYKKAGFRLRFYDLDPENLRPRFEGELPGKIAVLALCGYYGFSYYDRDFVERCAREGTAIVQDITHSALSEDGVEERADYSAGSLRKWLGVPSGGIAVKRRGLFRASLLPPEEEHLRGRLATCREREEALRGKPGASEERAEALFWETELRLRRIFDRHGGDPRSERILLGFPWREHRRRRRENYAFLLGEKPFGPRAFPVFPELPEGVCPSHFSLYSPDRERVQEELLRRGIRSTFYWPFHGEIPGETFRRDFPGAARVYDRVFSVPVDQRYSLADMELLRGALKAVSGG
jgi:hypothetical protein